MCVGAVAPVDRKVCLATAGEDRAPGCRCCCADYGHVTVRLDVRRLDARAVKLVGTLSRRWGQERVPG